MSFVGSYINPEVVQQLKNRSKILFKNDKTPEDIHYIGSRSAWVRLISGVNIGEDVRPAKEFILSNVINIDNDGKSSLNGGINFENSTGNNLYNYTQDYGIRPKPGITGFSIVSKNRFGTIREATVTFTVWSLDEFNTIENLYLRPGYQAVVEWGHTIYLDNDNTVAYTPPNKLKDIFEAKTLQEVAGILETNKKECDFNYDGFIGFIKNFSWSFRKDGGYDCTVSIISAGEILESLTMSINTAEVEEEQEKSTENLYTAIHAFIELINSVELVGEDLVKRYTITLQDLNSIQSRNQTRLTNYKTIINKLNKLGYIDNTPIGIGAKATLGGGKEIWIPLGLLLDILNSFYMPYKNICTDKEPPAFVKFDSKSPQKFLTFNGHHSLDPLTCLLTTGKKYTLQNSVYQKILQNILIDFYKNRREFFKGISLLPEEGLPDSGDNICNILVNCNIIKEEIDEISKDKKISVLSFVKNLLQRIQDSLGDINEFDIDFNEQDFTFSIVDRKLSPNSSTNRTASALPPELILTGKESIFTDLSIQSKISSALASQIAISAQTSSPDPNSTIPAMLDWNIGLTNRYLTETRGGIPEGDCNEPEQIIPDNNANASGFWDSILKSTVGIGYYTFPILLKNLKRRSDERKKYKESFDGLREKAFNFFNNIKRTGDVPSLVIRNDNADKKRFTALKIKGREEFGKQDGIKFYDNNDLNQIKTAQGIIPVELSFTTDGIGGLIIGQSFKVGPKILPTKYDPLGFIITGLDHKIEGGKWLTTVKAQTYIIPSTLEIERRPILDIIRSPFNPPSTTTPPPVQLPSLTPEQSPPRQIESSPEGEQPVEDESKFWTLVAICAREDNNPQGHADVAQSIYNRLKAPGGLYKTDIIKLITGKQEYEPIWRWPKPGKEGIANKEWKEITNLRTASQASGLSQDRLIAVALAIQNPELQQEAKDFILGRTDFFGTTINSTRMRLPVRRNSKSNQFGFRWKYQPIDEDKKPIAGTPAEVPSFINAIKLNIV